MSLIHELSSQTPLPKFDIFAVDPTQVVVERDIRSDHRPLSDVQSNQPIEFEIHSAYDEYICLNEAIFYLKLHVKLNHKVASEITSDHWSKVVPVNNLLHSIFESIEVYIGDTQINSSNGTYPYLAFFDALFNLHPKAISTYMTASLYNKSDTDRAAYITPETTATDKSIGKTCELAGKLHLDLFGQGRAILGGSTLRIKMTPHKSSFYLNISDVNVGAEVIFDDAHIEVHKSKLYEPIINAHEEALKIAHAKYPINRREVKAFSIPKLANDAFIDNAITGQLPRRLYITMVSNLAFHGNSAKNPFEFKHNKIDFICCYFNGQQFPQRAYKPDFTKNNYMREYLGLYETANQLGVEPFLDITRYTFKNDFPIFGFNFSPDLSDDGNSSGYVSLIKRGTLRVEIHFAEPLTEAMNVLLYAEYDNIVQITADRNGIAEFS